MANATAEKTVSKSDANQITQFLVWFGTLPASQQVDTYVPTKEADADTGLYYEIRKQHPHKMWSPDHGGPRVWVGKCRAFQSIGVKGFVFPAFSEAVEFGASETRNVSAPFPGAVQIMTRVEIDRIVSSCNKFVVRYNDMMGNRDIYSVENSGNVSVLDLEQGDKHADMSEAEFIAARRNAPVDRVFMNSIKDFYVSEFVYLVPIKIDDLESIHKMNGKKKILDVGACIQYLPNQRLDERFFTSPPKSVAEAFPQGK